MSNSPRRIGPLLAVLVLFATPGLAAPACTPESAKSAFEGLVRAFNSRNAATVMALFAPDAILSYPGNPDSGYDAIRQVFEKNYSAPDIQGSYSADIQEVQVSGDLAFVRAVWSADLVQISTGRTLKTQDKDLEIWRCQPDGSWKLYRGLSFPVEKPKKETPVAGP